MIHDSVSHYPVKSSLEVIRKEQPLGFMPYRLQSLFMPHIHQDIRIIGILRDPFDMLVSLFEFWRNVPRSSFRVEILPDLIQVAREGTFVRFIELAVVHKQVQTYKSFFDVGGPAWPQTYLIPFEQLSVSLNRLAHDLGLPNNKATLQKINVNPKPDRLIHTYLVQAASLVTQVEQHFSWYYTEGIQKLHIP